MESTNYRWSFFADDERNDRMMLKCSNIADSFTSKDKRFSKGLLKYSIGMLNSDEAVLAGGYKTDNMKYYLYVGNFYWTMSPSYFNETGAFVRIVGDRGYTHFGDFFHFVNESIGVKPVINLKSNSLKFGDGTMDNPYTVE